MHLIKYVIQQKIETQILHKLMASNIWKKKKKVQVGDEKP